MKKLQFTEKILTNPKRRITIYNKLLKLYTNELLNTNEDDYISILNLYIDKCNEKLKIDKNNLN